MSRSYKLNSEMEWNFTDEVPPNTPVWVLCEQDTCDPTLIPSVFRAMLDPEASPPLRLKMLDYDPDKQEHAISSNNWEVIAWRLMTDHGGTYDAYFEKHDVSMTSNWTLTLDAERRRGFVKGEEDASAGLDFADDYTNGTEFWFGYREGYQSVTYRSGEES